MPFAPAGSDFDRADQHTLAHPDDHDTGLDPAALSPPPDRLRAAFDSAELTDRIDQAWILPADDALDLLAY
ncbi:hypothetical protein [Nocardia asteroides]|uniref:hypothetical protein n=1 Tax=Nocardia asteroides TaxID=1824 RepID=UPI001E3BB312|nr:hypothetical protein [Nocardia asteroides]UGT62028.1 hypothetical protein LTT61_01330 [Nocardia asteroides]